MKKDEIVVLYKKCTKCGEEKLISEFDKSGRKKDGSPRYRSECKVCRKKLNKKYYEGNREYYSEYAKKYREENKDRISEYKNKYYEENKDRVSKHNKKYYEENKDRISEYKKKYYEENKDRISEYIKKHYEENKDKYKKYREENKGRISEYGKKYREENKDRISEYNKKYFKENREYFLAKEHERRVKTKTNGGSYTLEQLEECLEFFDYQCAYSGEKIEIDLSNFHREHIVPISKGGTNYIWNICTSVNWVNLSKHNSNMEEWYRKQPYFSEERLQKIYDWMEYAKKKYIQAVA